MDRVKKCEGVNWRWISSR